MTKRIILFLLGFVLLGSIRAKEVNKETASVTAVKALHKFAAGFSGNVQSVSPVMYQGTKAYYVVDKERLKEMKTNIDSLAMSATPIPRTLHMSLLKIRDMSLLTTPPHNRQPIETVIDGL